MEITEKSIKIRELVFTAIFTAIIIILSQISIPMPVGVPVTLQTFAVALCGYFLGARLGALSIIVYILLGAAGLPVFANFGSGTAVLFGMPGGFLWGFIFMVIACGLFSNHKNMFLGILMGILGLAVCHAAGITGFSLVTGNSFGVSFLLVSLPYIIKDVISVILAYYLAGILKRRLRDIW